MALQNKAIRSGVPIGPFQNKRKRKSRCSQDGSKPKKKAVVSGGEKGDLEVRKDLIISQEDLSTENVFQNDESCASTSNIVSKTKEESVNDPSQVVSVNSPIGGVHIKTVKKLNSDAVVAELELGVITDLPGSNLADSPKLQLYPYSCVNCSMMFSSAAQLKRHSQLSHSKDETLFCQVCPEKCSGKENLKLHLYKTHGIGEIFRCEECNYETPVKAVFLKHLSEHIPQEAIKKQCPKCDKVFKTKAGLKQHLKQHYDESLYSCLVCEFKTPQKLNLVKHTASKHGQDVEGRPLFENFACEFCDFKCIASVSSLMFEKCYSQLCNYNLIFFTIAHVEEPCHEETHPEVRDEVPMQQLQLCDCGEGGPGQTPAVQTHQRETLHVRHLRLQHPHSFGDGSPQEIPQSGQTSQVSHLWSRVR